MQSRETYPVGVPCWVDLVQPDVEATKAFYGGLFGWEFEPRTPPHVPNRYYYARLDGLTVAGIGGPPLPGDEGRGWTAYVRVDSAVAAADRAVAAGGRVLTSPADVGPPGRPTGRAAVVGDPAGAMIGVWEAIDLPGAQLVNVPGSWNFNDLHGADAEQAERFYAEVFGWELDVLDLGNGVKTGMWRRPGYGEFLAAGDPELRERQADGPSGFADAVALVDFTPSSGDDGGARWGTLFSVADADDALARAAALGATARTAVTETQYTRSVTVRDPQGAEIVLSQYLPPA